MYINLSICMLQMWCHAYFSRYSILKIHNNWKEFCNSWCNYMKLKKSDGSFPLTFKIFDLHKYGYYELIKKLKYVQYKNIIFM